MDDVLINSVFQLRPSKQEVKTDATTRAARAILNDETAHREAKTERLRLARLAQEAAAPTLVKPKRRTAIRSKVRRARTH